MQNTGMEDNCHHQPCTTKIHNNANVIVQRISDLQGFCSAGKLDSFSKVMPNEDSHNSFGSDGSNANQQNMMTGVIVNGFHPQLSAWKKNQFNIQHGEKQRELDKNICEAVHSCREEETDQIQELVQTKPHDRPLLSVQNLSVGDIYRDVFENSNVAQVIATPGKCHHMMAQWKFMQNMRSHQFLFV